MLPDQEPPPQHPCPCPQIVSRLPQRARGQEPSSTGSPSTRCPGGVLAQPLHPSRGAGSPARAAVASLRLRTPAGSAPPPPGGPAAMPGPAAPRGSGSRRGSPACTARAGQQARVAPPAAVPAPLRSEATALTAGPRPRTSPARGMAVPKRAAPVTSPVPQLGAGRTAPVHQAACYMAALRQPQLQRLPAVPQPPDLGRKREGGLRAPDQTWSSQPGLWVQRAGPRKGM